MPPVVKNILAVVVGIIAGSLVNFGLVNVGPTVIPLPEGADVSTMEGLKDSMKLFAPANFIFPFLAHARQRGLQLAGTANPHPRQGRRDPEKQGDLSNQGVPIRRVTLSQTGFSLMPHDSTLP